MKLYRIKKSDIDKKGKGLYATKDIKEGTRIIDYIGKLITKKQTEESDKYDNSKPIYLFTINKRYDLDGDFSGVTKRCFFVNERNYAISQLMWSYEQHRIVGFLCISSEEVEEFCDIGPDCILACKESDVFI